VVIALGVASIPLLRQWWLRWAGLAMLMGSVVVLMIGNVSANMNEVYRFPGPYVYGSDTRSKTVELVAAATWLSRTQGPGQPLIGDRGAQVAFASAALAQLGVPGEAYPLWDFILSPSPPSRSPLEATRGDKLRFVVVDEHQTRAIPSIGFYRDQTEPLALQRTEPLPTATLTKWDDMRYALTVYASDTIEIHRLDPTAYGLVPVPGGTAVPGDLARLAP
jgi:hypothetical protein